MSLTAKTIEFKDVYSTNIQSAIRKQGVEIFASLSKQHGFDLQIAIRMFILADEEKSAKLASNAMSKLASPEEKALKPKGRGKPKGQPLTDEEIALKKQADNDKRKAKALEKRLAEEREAIDRGETPKVRKTRQAKTSQVKIASIEPDAISRTPSPEPRQEQEQEPEQEPEQEKIDDEFEFHDFPDEKHVMFLSSKNQEYEPMPPPVNAIFLEDVIDEDNDDVSLSPTKDKKHKKKETKEERAERKKREKEAEEEKAERKKREKEGKKETEEERMERKKREKEAKKETPAERAERKKREKENKS
jgi:peroxiredoxin Q/BCP